MKINTDELAQLQIELERYINEDVNLNCKIYEVHLIHCTHHGTYIKVAMIVPNVTGWNFNAKVEVTGSEWIEKLKEQIITQYYKARQNL